METFGRREWLGQETGPNGRLTFALGGTPEKAVEFGRLLLGFFLSHCAPTGTKIMAGFKTHIGTSTVLGIAYGTVGYWGYHVPPETCMLAAGLCSLSGMIPDLDSDSGVPVRETVGLVAAVTPMLMINRFEHMHWSHERIVVAAAITYLVVRFGVAWIFKTFTVHRGMWHSIPAMFTASLLAFLLYSTENMALRIFVAGAVTLGFFSHLLLDEIWSVSFGWTGPHLKKSFGTALKFWGPSRWANFSVYAKLAVVATLAVGDPVMMAKLGYHPPESLQTAHGLLEKVIGQGTKVVR